MAKQEKPENWIKDRRQDHAQRLKHAVKKAHDPVFAPTDKREEPAAPGAAPKRRQ